MVAAMKTFYKESGPKSTRSSLSQKYEMMLKSKYVCHDVKTSKMKGFHNVSFNPFVPNTPFLFLLKTSENRQVF